MNFPTPLSPDGRRRLEKLKIILTHEDIDLVDAAKEIIQQQIDDETFVEQLEKPYYVPDLLTRAQEQLSKRG